MSDIKKESPKSGETPRREPNWPKVLFQLYVHSSFVYGTYFLIQAKLFTIAFTLSLVAISILGSTAGAHRLWAHRSYSAHVSLRIFLMLCHTLGGTGTIYNWVLDHRIHHKFHGTKDDPFNYNRGFFYAHLGNRMIAHPNKKEIAKEIDMSDIESDKIVMFQKRFYWILMPIISLLLPINAPAEYWGEGLLVSMMAVASFRIPVILHVTWLINSARSIWGLKPNDRFFSDSNLVFLIRKSHWHAYHYIVPWDCLTEEFSSYNCSCTTIFIKIWAAMGLATNLKTIDGKGLTMALEQAMDTGKPISDCITEMRDEMQLFHHGESNLRIIETSTSIAC